MSLYCDIAIAIGGKPDVINPFIATLKQEAKENIYQLNSFQTINLEDDLTIFVFYERNAEWDRTKMSTWRNLCELADKHLLSWVIYLVSECFTEQDELSNNTKDHFDNR